MWKKIAPLLIVLSVALNIAFISVWAVHAARAHWPTKGNGDGEIWCPLHRRLNMTDEQWREIEPGLVKFQESARGVCDEVNRLRCEMIDLIAASDADPEAIRAKQEEIFAAQKRLQELVIERLVTEKQLLKPEQQRQLFQMMRSRFGCGGHGRMTRGRHGRRGRGPMNPAGGPRP